MECESGLYRNWFIGIFPFEGGWRFRCRAPSGKVCTYEKSYKYSQAALSAAREFVDRDITKVLLAGVLEEWLQANLVFEEEYQQAQEFLYLETHPANCLEKK